MSKLKKGDTESDVGWQCDRLIYGDDGDFEVYAVRDAKDGHKPWRMRLMYPAAGVSRSNAVNRARWTAESLMDALQSTLREIRAGYGGSWYLDIRNHVPEDKSSLVQATAQEKAEFRQKLYALMASMCPPVPKRPPLPSREILEKIGREEPGATEPDDNWREPKPLPTRDLSHIPVPPKADAAWFEQESKELAKENA